MSNKNITSDVIDSIDGFIGLQNLQADVKHHGRHHNLHKVQQKHEHNHVKTDANGGLQKLWSIGDDDHLTIFGGLQNLNQLQEDWGILNGDHVTVFGGLQNLNQLQESYD